MRSTSCTGFRLCMARADGTVGLGRNTAPTPPLFNESLRQTAMERRGAHLTVALVKPQRPITRVAEPRGVCQHGIEHRLQFTRRRADDAQHLGGRGLLLQRFGELARALLLRLEQPHVLDGDHRLIGERRIRAGFLCC